MERNQFVAPLSSSSMDKKKRSIVSDVEVQHGAQRSSTMPMKVQSLVTGPLLDGKTQYAHRILSTLLRCAALHSSLSLVFFFVLFADRLLEPDAVRATNRSVPSSKLFG